MAAVGLSSSLLDGYAEKQVKSAGMQLLRPSVPLVGWSLRGAVFGTWMLCGPGSFCAKYGLDISTGSEQDQALIVNTLRIAGILMLTAALISSTVARFGSQETGRNVCFGNFFCVLLFVSNFWKCTTSGSCAIPPSLDPETRGEGIYGTSTGINFMQMFVDSLLNIFFMVLFLLGSGFTYRRVQFGLPTYAITAVFVAFLSVCTALVALLPTTLLETYGVTPESSVTQSVIVGFVENGLACMLFNIAALLVSAMMTKDDVCVSHLSYDLALICFGTGIFFVSVPASARINLETAVACFSFSMLFRFLPKSFSPSTSETRGVLSVKIDV